MRADVNYSHSKNIGESIGHDFCGVPINAYSIFDLELDVALDAQRTVLRNRAMGCSDIPNTAEILPGELLCSDNVIRRETTAEATGYDSFKEQNPVKLLVGADDGRLYDSEENAWYLKEKKLRQSTPEELCAWLNDIPKRGFKSEVELRSADKNVVTNDVNGKPLYAFRYFEGNPGTYQGGEEARLLDLPQRTLGRNTPSRVIQYFDDGNNFKRNPVELKEYADEWVSKYTPTSHVERITVGGTAFFAPEEEKV